MNEKERMIMDYKETLILHLENNDWENVKEMIDIIVKLQEEE